MARSFHSPLTRKLREAQAACEEAQATGAPIDEISDIRAERRARLDRRDVLAGAAAIGLGAAAWPRRVRARAKDAPRIVIVGAGLAGLACAQQLWTGRGLASTIYEASDLVGGRVRSLRGYFANGEVAEMCGEFISSEHVRMRALASLYGLTLLNTNATLGADQDTQWFNGARYPQSALNRAWRDGVWDLFRDAVARAPGANYLHASPTAKAWDRLSVPDWINRYVPGGVDGQLGGLCISDVLSEYGGPAEQQSALNLIYLLGYDTSAASGYQSRSVPLLAGTDEKWTVKGGNDQIVAGLLEELPQGAVKTGCQLVSVALSGSTYTCTFQSGSSTIDVLADEVVLAIPPTTLRDVDLGGVPLPPLKKIQIAELQLGANAKVFVQVAGRPWAADGFTGSQLTDRPIGGGWDSSCYDPGSRGPHAQSVYAFFPGGAAGAGLAAKYGLVSGAQPAPAALVSDYLAQLESILPGVTAAYGVGSKLAFCRDPNIDPFLRGAYSYYQVGQYTRFSGVEQLPVGNLHFAGEHTCPQFQGYMEGAVRSGYRAAAEIQAAV
jgi:monoamine oxidase